MTESAPVEVNPLNPNTRFYISPEGDVLDAKTYARNSGFRKGVRDEVWGDAVDSETGLVRDPLSGAVMNKEEARDMGHRPGMEYWKERDNTISRWLNEREHISRKEFLDKMNDPKRYRPELPSSNRSHRGEDATHDFWE
ncbi:MAG: GH-E family nuclease [Acidihalobacter sp.]|uniref:GH-E family nuclease n=1 Tax=Acidihalobacter sp. TaxID=1872108 RepID=UPI00307FAECB